MTTLAHLAAMTRLQGAPQRSPRQRQIRSTPINPHKTVHIVCAPRASKGYPKFVGPPPPRTSSQYLPLMCAAQAKIPVSTCKFDEKEKMEEDEEEDDIDHLAVAIDVHGIQVLEGLLADFTTFPHDPVLFTKMGNTQWRHRLSSFVVSSLLDKFVWSCSCATCSSWPGSFELPKSATELALLMPHVYMLPLLC